jgi:hypothetical protein
MLGGRSGRGGGRGPDKTTYYSQAEWDKLSNDERNRICKESDKKGEQDRTKLSVSKLTTKHLVTAIISSIQKATSCGSEEQEDTTSKKSTNAGNLFGGKESVKQSKTH